MVLEASSAYRMRACSKTKRQGILFNSEACISKREVRVEKEKEREDWGRSGKGGKQGEVRREGGENDDRDRHIHTERDLTSMC